MDTRATDRRPVHHGDGRHPSRERLFVVGLLFFLLLLSVVPWRAATIYEGGVDSVVVGKALVALVTMAAALGLVIRTRVRIPIGLGPAGLISVALLISLLGSLVAGNEAATIVLIVRVFMVMATVLLLLTSVRWYVALGALMAAMAVLGMLAAVTGVGTFLATGRLGGGIPEIHPNEVAGLVGPPIVALVILMLRTRVRLWSIVMAMVLLVILVASGSRTALLGVLVAIAVAVVTNGIRNRSVVFLLLGILPVAYAVAAFTGVIGGLATRGGSTDTTSALDSRFDAWRVVLGWDWSAWEKWIGLGLAVKKVKVDIQYRDEQVLDSSWASLLAQAGLIGTALIAAVIAWCVIAAVVSRSRRGAVLPLLVLLVMRSVTESGLLDSAVPFILLMVIATVLTHRSRHSVELLAGVHIGPTLSERRARVA